MNRKPLLTRCVARLCALLLLGFAPAAFHPAGAQEKARGLTLDEYKKAKTFAVNDLDNDTYLKFENAYVLDRYEMRPPYVFKYSDGIERRIYLYRLLDNKTKASLGMTAVYFTPGDGKKIHVCIPNPQAEKAVWAQYIDDLKEYAGAEKGFGSAFAYVTSRELAALAGGGAGATAASAGKTDFDVCFPRVCPGHAGRRYGKSHCRRTPRRPGSQLQLRDRHPPNSSGAGRAGTRPPAVPGAERRADHHRPVCLP
jgi:hypothetical protein